MGGIMITAETMREHVDEVLPRVLVVDDDEQIRVLLSSFLEREGYDCVATSSIGGAIDILKSTSYGVLLLDFKLGDGTAFRLMDSIPNLSENAVVMLISGARDIRIAVEAMRRGVTDFIEKPFTTDDLKARFRVAVERWRFREQARFYQSQLDGVVSRVSGGPALTGEQASKVYDETVHALGAALNLRDPETEEHCERVSENSIILARTCGFSEEALTSFRWGAYLHDIGKIGIPDRILLKPAALDLEEMKLVQIHPVLGHRMVSNIGFLRNSADTILYHHEWYDGSGYPSRLKGKMIPLAARIFAVIDTMDAMLYDRPYHKAVAYDEAASEIAGESGSHFDPRVVEKFLLIPETVWQETAKRSIAQIRASRNKQDLSLASRGGSMRQHSHEPEESAREAEKKS